MTAKRRGVEIASQVVRTYEDYTKDPAVLYAARQQAIEQRQFAVQVRAGQQAGRTAARETRRKQNIFHRRDGAFAAVAGQFDLRVAGGALAGV